MNQHTATPFRHPSTQWPIIKQLRLCYQEKIAGQGLSKPLPVPDDFIIKCFNPLDKKGVFDVIPEIQAMCGEGVTKLDRKQLDCKEMEPLHGKPSRTCYGSIVLSVEIEYN
jgi:hypothetical protein